MILNPWKEIKRLKSELVAAETYMRDLEDNASEAEAKAMSRADAIFTEKYRILEYHNKHLLETIVGFSNMTPRPLMVIEDFEK